MTCQLSLSGWTWMCELPCASWAGLDPLDDEFLREVTGDMPAAKPAQGRRLGFAITRTDRTATVKAADIRIGIDWTPWLALQPQPRHGFSAEARHRGNERLRIWMPWSLKYG